MQGRTATIQPIQQPARISGSLLFSSISHSSNGQEFFRGIMQDAELGFQIFFTYHKTFGPFTATSAYHKPEVIVVNSRKTSVKLQSCSAGVGSNLAIEASVRRLLCCVNHLDELICVLLPPGVSRTGGFVFSYGHEKLDDELGEFRYFNPTFDRIASHQNLCRQC